MIKFFLQRLGVDYVQWMALTKVSIKKDFRQSSMSSTLRHGRTGGRPFSTLIFFYLVTGLFFALLVFTNQDVFFTATLLIAYTMFMIGGLILVEYHTVVVSPDDYEVLSYRPISSKTYFFVRFANILFYVLTFTTVMALPAVISFSFTLGFNPILGIVALVSVYLANVAITLAMILFYTLILKKVSLRRLQNVLAYFQVALSFIIYSGYFFLPRLLENRQFESFRLPDSPWLMFLPPAWFSRFLKIYLGETVSLDWIVSFFSIVVTFLLGYFAFSKISINYSESLATLAEAPSGKRLSKKGQEKPFWYLIKGFEERVVSKLIRNQFLHDNKFKLAVLGILPLTVFYLLIGLEKGPLPDPFETHEFDMGRTGILYFAVLLFPMMLRTYVTQSDAFQASWIFYTTPTNVNRLILAEKIYLMIYFVVPFLIILGIVFFYFFNNIWHVLLHLLILGLLANLFLQLAFLYSPDLPFSRPNVKSSKSKNIVLFLVFIPIVIFLILPLIFKFVYPNLFSFITFTITLLIVSIFMENLVKVRISSKMKKLEFFG